MIATARAIVVEGRYDRERVREVADALVITTDGFNIRRDREKQQLIKRLARECGIIILTDSDGAGFEIRRFVEDIAGRENALNAYIPDIEGRERRKTRPSSDGLLGVEGVASALVERALSEALSGETAAPPGPALCGEPLTAADLYADGLGGCERAHERRARFLSLAGLPARLSTKAMLAVVNRLLGREGYEDILRRMDEKQDGE